MSNEVQNLQLGTLDWQHESWVGSYYPEDMPEEWQLDFYSNQFHLVLLSQSQWSALDSEACDEIMETLSEEEFRIYLLLDKVDDLSRFETQLDLLAEGLASSLVGVFLNANLKSVELMKVIERHNLTLTFYGEECERGEGWSWQADQYCLWGAPVGWLQQQPMKPKEQTVWLQSFMNSLPATCLQPRLFVGRGGVDMKALQQMRILSEFLGY